MSSPSRSGVFQHKVDPRVERFSESISFDHRLYRQDIQGSLAHAEMLCRVGLLTRLEADQIRDTLEAIRGELDRGEFPFSASLEDIHMHVEQALIERLGDVGRKLHTGRSRNDQISTDLRLWCREAIDEICEAIRELQRAFVARCEADHNVIVPAYTHLRRAQPVLAAHYWLAYCEKLERDRERLLDGRRRVNRSVLGAAAVAGTSLPIDRELTAHLLGFEGLMANSLDASSDRDFMLEFAFGLSLIAIHLSGWAEEWILWSTTEFGFLQLPDAFCTGSSIMPQKVNPDVLELIRGRTGRAVGGLQSLLLLVKGLPLAYNRDLQEDKLPLFAAYDSVLACLQIAAPIVRESILNRSEIAARIEEGYLDATTLMEILIARGLPQREAHHRVGALVQRAQEQGRALGDLPLELMQSICPEIDAEARAQLGSRSAVEAFRSEGSTAPRFVAKQIEAWRAKLA